MRALCLSLFLSVSLSLFSQITVTVENTPLRAALKKIEQVSDYKFFYNEKLAGLDQAVTFSVSNATIAQTMQKVLAGKELTYKMESDNVVVLLHKEAVSQKTKTITGTIVDSSGEPVIGASIVVKGTTNGTITDVDGNYSLSNVPENSTVSISYIGYQPLSYPASSKELSRVILKEDAEMLDSSSSFSCSSVIDSFSASNSTLPRTMASGVCNSCEAFSINCFCSSYAL